MNRALTAAITSTFLVLAGAACASAGEEIWYDGSTDTSGEDTHDTAGPDLADAHDAADPGTDTGADPLPEPYDAPDGSPDPTADPGEDLEDEPDAASDPSSDAVTDASTTCPGSCTASPVTSCSSDVAVVGHYVGGTKTVCIEAGDGSAIRLALMSYEVTNWTLAGAVHRVSALDVYGHDGIGTLSGTSGIPTTTHGTGGTCNPYSYAGSMGDCPAHTGWTGCIYGVPATSVCHMEIGLSSECSYPSYSCLSINP